MILLSIIKFGIYGYNKDRRLATEASFMKLFDIMMFIIILFMITIYASKKLNNYIYYLYY